MRTRLIDCWCVHFFTVNGPVPTGDSQFAAWLRFSAVADSIASQGWESESSRALSGLERVKRATSADTVVTAVTFCSAR